MLVAGAFLDLTAIMLIVVPLSLPLILQLGVDPVHFGIIVVVNLMLGGLTPPYGLLVFIPSAITGTSVQATFRAVMPRSPPPPPALMTFFVRRSISKPRCGSAFSTVRVCVRPTPI